MKEKLSHKIFVDTGPFYAKYAVSDEHHDQAIALWTALAKQEPFCVTTNLVVAELVTLMIYRFGSQAGLAVGRELYTSNFVRVVSVTHDVELGALSWIERFADQKFSMTDAVSFFFMTQNKIHRAFAFDRHFSIAGFDKFET